jgi:hypothetical protein
MLPVKLALLILGPELKSAALGGYTPAVTTGTGPFRSRNNIVNRNSPEAAVDTILFDPSAEIILIPAIHLQSEAHSGSARPWHHLCSDPF